MQGKLKGNLKDAAMAIPEAVKETKSVKKKRSAELGVNKVKEKKYGKKN